MKKFLGLVLGLTLIFVWALTGNLPKAKADSAIEAQCTFAPAAWRAAGVNLTETFKPTFDRLDRVDFEIWGAGTVRMEIRDHGLNLLKAKNINLNPPVGDPHKVYTMSFDPLIVTPGESHYLYLMNASADGAWAYTANAGCYANGAATVGGVPVAGVADFYFRAWGYNHVAEEPPPVEPPAETPTPPAATPVTPTTPTVTIEPPTNLLAKDTTEDRGGVLKIYWDASKTTDIDGYEVFRSTNENGDFTSLGKTKKDVLKFIDNQATVGQTFFYTVRAYKGDHQSVDSNKASAKSLAEKSPKTAASTASKTGFTLFGLTFVWYYWLAIGVGALAILVTIIWLIARSISKKKKNPLYPN